MKNLMNKYFLLFAVIAGFNTSCKDDEVITSYNESYVSFSQSAATVAESTVVSSAAKADSKVGVQFNVTIVRSNIQEAQVVNFTLSGKFASTSAFADEGDDASSTFFVSADGTDGNYSIEIPAGQSSASFFVRTIDDLFSSGDKVLTIEITGAGSLNLGRGPSQVNKKLTLTIADDDCPIAIADWVGTYTVKEAFTSGANAPFGLVDFFGETYQVELALDPTDGTGTKVIITNSAGFNNYFDAPAVMSFVTCTKEIKFDAGNPRVAEFAVLSITATSYNESKFEIVASGPLATYGPYQFVLTKQ
jgi:hypothetical protein